MLIVLAYGAVMKPEDVGGINGDVVDEVPADMDSAALFHIRFGHGRGYGHHGHRGHHRLFGHHWKHHHGHLFGHHHGRPFGHHGNQIYIHHHHHHY